MVTLRVVMVFFLLVTLPSFLCGKDKKPKAPPRICLNAKIFESNCDTVWTAALPLLTEAGLAPQAMDRQVGFASFKWTKGQYDAFDSNDFVRSFKRRPLVSGRRLEWIVGPCWSAQRALAAGARSNWLTPLTHIGRSWIALESNGCLEDLLLTRIEELARARTQANLKTSAVPEPAPEASKPGDAAKASVNISSTPSGADIEVDGSFVGNTPSKFDFAAGKRQIRISKPGHRSWMRHLDLLPGANITLSAELVEGQDRKPVGISNVAPEMLAKSAPEAKPVPATPKFARVGGDDCPGR